MIRALPALLLAAAVAAQGEPAPAPAVTLQGRVVDVFGEPVPAAAITVRDARDAAPCGRATSDGEGLWQLGRLPGDAALVVEASAPGKVPGRVTGLRNPDGVVLTCNFELLDGVSLRGIVHADGAPVADAAVFVRAPEFWAAVRTDAQGRYAFAAVPVLGAQVSCASAGRMAGDLPIDGRERREVVCDLLLEGVPTGRRRLLAEGLPAELRARSWFEVSAAPGASLLRLPVGDDSGVALEPWSFAHEVVLHVPGRTVAPPFARCPSGAADDLTFRVEPAVPAPSHLLRGAVRDVEDAAVAGAEVVVTDRTGVRLAAATTDAKGGFAVVIARPRGAMLMLRAVEPMRMLVAEGTATLGFDEVSLAAQPCAAVAGQLVDARGDALAFTEVAVLVLRGQQNGVARRRAVMVTDRAGRFVVRGLAAGRAAIQVRDARGNCGAAEVHLVLGQVGVVGALAFAPGATIAGRIVDAQGRPVPGLRVHATARTRGGPGELGSITARTDRDGRYRLHGLAPGEQALQVVDLDGHTFLGTAQVHVVAGEIAEQGFAVVPGGR